MPRLVFGFFFALLVAIGLSLITSLLICLGLSPTIRADSDISSPLLGILAGAYVASRGASWKHGAGIGLTYVLLWIGFWMYVMGRWNPIRWIEEGLPHLTLLHLAWWAGAVAMGILGSLLRKVWLPAFALIFGVLSASSWLAMFFLAGDPAPSSTSFHVEHFTPTADGTFGYFLSFDFQKQSSLNIGLYDCDSDDSTPYDDVNTSYMGQDLAALVDKLNFQRTSSRRQILCVINGGFFGASGWSVAHHEEPLVEDGRALYPVDLLRPKDQAWFFGIRSPNAVLAGHPRFGMFPSTSRDLLADYQTVLGGVRPLVFEGRAMELKPGAGVTTLKCSRTSVGWTADGSTFFVLTVFDPDGELASQLQKKMGGPQTGGRDVAEVQKFWLDRHVPYALLFDGGESTQLAFRQDDAAYAFVPSGYQYSFTLGYLFQRPLRFTLPILPPSEAHRGVLDYLYVDGRIDSKP